jgi:lysophospholipase L1-like esterase
LARILGLALVTAASLLAFPGGIPWMIAFWHLWATVGLVRARKAFLPFAACVAIVLVKRAPWTPGLGLLAGVMSTALAAAWLVRKSEDRRAARPIVWLGIAAVWLAWLVMAADWSASVHGSRRLTLVPGRPVVCLGDSMTSMGPPQGGYPEVLSGLVSIPVVNLGQPGITTRQATALLPRLDDADPQVVVLELGGNDFVQGQSRAAVKENLERLIQACLKKGAEVVLVEMPRGYVSDPYWGLERELARHYTLELVPDTALRRLLLSSPTMPPGQWTRGPYLTQDDGLHPNARGNRLLAEYVADALERIYGPAIRRESW